MIEQNLTESSKYSELSALISMMDEPNETNFGSIRNKISDYGIEAIPFLEDAWLDANSDLNIYRIEGLIDEIRFNDLYFELENWVKFHNNDLLKAFMLLGKFRYPDFEQEKYWQKINKIKQDIWLEMNENLTALEKVKVLNHIFYDVHKFRGVLPHQTNINAYFLPDLLDSSKGSAISLGILYSSLCNTLSIPIFGVDLHQHFILAYMEDNMAMRTAEEYSEDDVLFYLAAVNKGSVFTRKEINRYLEQSKLSPKPTYYMPSGNLQIVKRLINEMISAYKKEKKEHKVEYLIQLLNLIDQDF